MPKNGNFQCQQKRHLLESHLIIVQQICCKDVSVIQSIIADSYRELHVQIHGYL